MCEVLGLCYFQLNTVVLFVVLRTMMRSITVSAKIGTDERSSVRYTSTQCNSLVLTLKFMQAKKATFNRYKWYVFLPFSAEISVEFLMFLKMGHL